MTVPYEGSAPGLYRNPDDPSEERYWTGTMFTPGSRPAQRGKVYPNDPESPRYGLRPMPASEERASPASEGAKAKRRAFEAAGRLNNVAVVLILIVSLAVFIGLIGLIVLAIETHSHREKVLYIALGLGAVIAWLQSLLVLLAASAIAKYIQARTVATSHSSDGPSPIVRR